MTLPPAVTTAVVLGLGSPEGTADLPPGLTPILGRSPFQRHLHHLADLGVERCVIAHPGWGPRVGGGDPAVEAQCRRQREELAIAPALSFDALSPEASSGESGHRTDVLVVRGDVVFDPRLYHAVAVASAPTHLVDRVEAGSRSRRERLRPLGLARLPVAALGELEPDWPARSTGGSPTATAAFLEVDALDPYLPALRRRLRPYWSPARTPSERRRAADLLLDATQKGVLDFPARYLHPIPENSLARWLAGMSVTPNHVTLLTALLGFGVTFLFATGSFGWGLILALCVNVLDGVDGKLARVKLLSSRFGGALDHGLDITFEFSWYLALGWGLTGGTATPSALGIGLLLIPVMLSCRAVSGVYHAISGHQIHDHTRFDRAFRLVAARRNIFVMILLAGLLLGSVGGAFRWALVWAGATLAVYLMRTLGSAVGRWGGRAPRSGPLEPH